MQAGFWSKRQVGTGPSLTVQEEPPTQYVPRVLEPGNVGLSLLSATCSTPLYPHASVSLGLPGTHTLRSVCMQKGPAGRAGFTCSHARGLGRSHGALWIWDGPSELCSTEARRQGLCTQLPQGREPNNGPGSFLRLSHQHHNSLQLGQGESLCSCPPRCSCRLPSPFHHCLGSASPSVSTFSV